MKKGIPFTVFLIHASIIALALYFHTEQKQPLTKKPIHVTTYIKSEVKRLETPLPTHKPNQEQVNVKTPLPIEEAKIPPSPPPVVKTEIKELPKSSESERKKTKVQESKPKASTSPKPKETPTKTKSQSAPTASKSSSHQQQLISLMQESLNKLDEVKGAESSSKAGKKTKLIGQLSSETVNFETNYEEELISYLQQMLTLPEKGALKLKLILKRDGTVQEVAILSATSERNRTYVRTSLNSLHFPVFGSQFKKEVTHAFTITLISEDLD